MCRSARISRKPRSRTSPNLLYMLLVLVARCSSGGVAICYVLPVLWMTSRFHIMNTLACGGVSLPQQPRCNIVHGLNTPAACMVFVAVQRGRAKAKRVLCPRGGVCDAPLPCWQPAVTQHRRTRKLCYRKDDRAMRQQK